MSDHADTIREALPALHQLGPTCRCKSCSAHAAVSALVAECEDWAVNYDDLQAKTRKQVLRAEAAEARVTVLEARLAEADEIIDDCWHQFAIDIRGKLTPGGLSTLEMVDDYRNSRDALAKEDTDE